MSDVKLERSNDGHWRVRVKMHNDECGTVLWLDRECLNEVSARTVYNLALDDLKKKKADDARRWKVVKENDD